MIAFTIIYVMWFVDLVITNRLELVPIVSMIYFSAVYIGWKIDELETPHREN